MATIRSLLKFWALSAFAVFGWLRLKLARSPTLIILTYHRVLPDNSGEREQEQPGMIISPGNLQRHIKFARSLGAVPVHLDEWLRKKDTGETLPALSVAFTFDDGWRDNYLYGYPVLRQEQVPATIFLVTGMVDTGDTFWPETVIRLLRTPGINLNDQSLEWLQPYLGDLGNYSTPLSLLEADEIVNRLKDLDDATIIQHLKEATSRLTAEINGGDQAPVILQSQDLKEMSGENLVKYGAHTRNHFRLNRLNSREALEEQITGCLSDLEAMNLNSVPIFCYPNGDITDGGEQLVANHYQAACTTKTGWNRASRSNFDLHRFNLHDGNSSTPRTLLATIGRSLA
ncbi:polysaccharide deacetylase family protein [Marinobacter sp. SS13-12]|uniref:polysaccharide deacetylase family protein n=1 Tax=Marinobacter sp. SS13-12 TaxID=3050451 RepID=UPI002554873D|nr:polysaccharide deacetylase family protein [Marinobacter sp. SS13-12]MDK8464272.1 polysaccharide deacetylase family protein [Marinobacter sp. SS13-12]